MGRKKLLKHLVVLMFFIFIVSALNERFYWDTLFWYFDVIAHTLGGAWVAMFFMYFFTRHQAVYTKREFFFKVIAITLVVGLLWEFYEMYIYQVVSLMPFNSVDTTTDMLCDLAGAVAAFWYYFKYAMVLEKNKVKS